MFFTGALEYWVLGELDADEFRAQVRHGFSLRLLPLSGETTRPGFLHNIAITRPVINAVVERVYTDSASIKN